MKGQGAIVIVERLHEVEFRVSYKFFNRETCGFFEWVLFLGKFIFVIIQIAFRCIIGCQRLSLNWW